MTIQDSSDDEKQFRGGEGFFAPPNGEPSGPGCVLAAIEVPSEGDAQVDELASEPVHLECVDVDWLANGDGDIDELLWEDSYAPLSVLEFDLLPSWVQPDGLPGSINWYVVDYEPTSSSNADGRIYKNLFSPGTPVKIVRTPSRVEGPRPARLDSSFHIFRSCFAVGSARQAGGASAEDWCPACLEAGLRTFRDEASFVRKTSGVAVYDVGQGAWQGLLDADGSPFAFVDVGGGVLYNRRTFPKDFQRPPTAPLIILSHWDWDHWSSAARYRSLLKSTWIAPSISEKPIQRRFAMDIVREGRLHLLPRKWNGSLRAGCIRIEGCDGDSENDRGLAVTAYSRMAYARSCLLPGDAAYRNIASVREATADQFHTLCMSHHGGRLHSRHYPIPKRRAVAVNSSGPGNTYRHPLFATLEAHKDKGWPMPIQTGASGSRPCHIFVPWGSKPQIFHGTADVRTAKLLSI